MNQKWMTWSVFLLCLAVVSAAMGWISRTVLQLERAEFETARQSENERLALWRMDSALVPLIARESARSVLDYRPFRLARGAVSKSLKPFASGEVRIASPLLSYESPYIVLHFQFEPGGELTSPQVPTGGERQLALTDYTTVERIDEYAARLDRLRSSGILDTEWWGRTEITGEHWGLGGVGQQEPAVAFRQPSNLVPAETPPQPAAGPRQQALPNQPVGPPQQDVQQESAQGESAQGSRQQAAGFAQQIVRQSQASQELRSFNELRRRQLTNFANTGQPNIALPAESMETNIQHQAMKATWFGDDLVLVRWVRAGDREYVQGCLFDWPQTQAWLTDTIKDLLPEARLVPGRPSRAAEQPLMLAALPVKLVPGRTRFEPLPLLTPIRFSLLVAWTGVVLAALAVGALLLAAIRLSERRGAFVSAVTHELRTPLTTFRMYTEMLAEGMVESQQKRHGYLETLRLEADRLGHLVENVLSYARLERNRRPTVCKRLALGELLTRLADSLRQRAEQASMQLVLECEEASSPVVQADAAAVERILFNLVDNACKYAADARDRRIHLECRSHGKQAVIRVRDHGGGISRRTARRLFRPFSKSADEAAHSAPGVGLGLALSRRLARNMGGELRIDHGVEHGACLVLTLPAASL